MNNNLYKLLFRGTYLHDGTCTVTHTGETSKLYFDKLKN